MTARSETGGSPLVVLGEIRTGLLMNRSPLPAPADARLLELVPGERVRVHERPVRRVVSADLPYGVDCPLFTETGRRVRGIGTLLTRACVVGGRIVQGSTRAVVVAGADRRLPWAHYLTRPGVVETGGRGAPENLRSRFLAGRDDDGLDPGAVSASLVGRVQRSPLLDHRAAFPARRTRLRWAAAVGGEGFHGAFALADDETRTLRLTLGPTAAATPERLATLCEDLALHDWLLTTVALVVERACVDGDSAGLRALRPVVDGLVHLWMPGAGVAPGLLKVWEHLEERPGLTRQWNACVHRLRDHMALRALELMTARREDAPPG
ncbi:SCO2521 family protein [Streptomyces sp. NBC_00459]|uniref:SCO2521 family protein n=1 Tax=Streptomyces sp. NBC_00459 TaxID=2975749 RepID=UPI002E188987